MTPHYYDHHAHALVGCAIGHVCVGSAEDLRAAERAVGRAFQLFVRSGLTPQQAVQRIATLTEMFSSLE